MSVTHAADENQQPMPRWLMMAPVLYIAGLVVTLVVFRNASTVNVFGLRVPLMVAWFGALGGVVDSLQGIFLHNRHWDPSYNIWHIFSGTIGIAYGFAAYLFLLVVVKSAVPSSSGGTGPVFALAAFALGYGQSQFHTMMQQVYSIIFQPKGSAAGTGTGQKKD